MLKTNGPQQQTPPKIAKIPAEKDVALELTPLIEFDNLFVFIISSCNSKLINVLYLNLC
jgi:hypothetical protein